MTIPIWRAEINAWYRCNLACRGCCNYSWLAEDEPDTDVLVNTIKKWSQRITPEVFVVTGGEPLLNPRLFELLDTIRNCWPNSRFEINHNGTLLHSLSEEQLQKLKDLDIVLYIKFKSTESHKKNAALISQLHKLRVKTDIPVSIYKWRVEYETDEHGLPVASNSNPKQAHKNCCRKMGVTLYDDKIYYCSAAFWMRHLDKTRALPAFELIKDHKPATLNNSDKEIEDYLKAPHYPMCSTCISELNYMYTIEQRRVPQLTASEVAQAKEIAKQRF